MHLFICVNTKNVLFKGGKTEISGMPNLVITPKRSIFASHYMISTFTYQSKSKEVINQSTLKCKNNIKYAHKP